MTFRLSHAHWHHNDLVEIFRRTDGMRDSRGRELEEEGKNSDKGWRSTGEQEARKVSPVPFESRKIPKTCIKTD